jgi:hypothetical protein
MKGMFDAADDLPGSRIAYMTVLQATATFVKGLLYLVIGLIAYVSKDFTILFVGIFWFAALASLGILSERFKALRISR